MAKNNQKKEKALRNKENARKYRKKPTSGRRKGPGGGGRPGGVAPSAPATQAAPATTAS